MRGAITLDSDTPEEVEKQTVRLLETVLMRNSIDQEHIISLFFTATADVSSLPPAAAVRRSSSLKLQDTPMLCAQEMAIPGTLPLCIRLFMHVETPLSKADMVHVFLRGATELRPDLAQPGDERR